MPARTLLLRSPLWARRRPFSTQSPHHDVAVGPLACRLASRSVVRFAGPDTIKFLQGLLTNDVRRLADDAATTSYLPTPNLNHSAPPPVYAALLNPQGRFLYDLFLYRPPRPEGMIDSRTGAAPGGSDSGEPFSLVADVDSEVVDELLSLLKRYRLRSKVDIENVAKELVCWQRFGSDLSSKSASSQEPEASSIGWGTGADQTGEAAAQGSDHGWQWFRDPRLDCLGFRGIFPVDMIPPLVEADKEADERHYLAWRLEMGVSEGSSEIPKGEAIPLEYNLAGLNAISFDKGCYVGQELVARTHHRGVIRKRLVPLRFVSKSGEELEPAATPDSEIVDHATGKKVGTVRVALGSRGMGLIRIEEVVKQSSTLSIKDAEDVRVRATKPDWWPSEWTQLQEQNSIAA